MEEEDIKKTMETGMKQEQFETTAEFGTHREPCSEELYVECVPVY